MDTVWMGRWPTYRQLNFEHLISRQPRVCFSAHRRTASVAHGSACLSSPFSPTTAIAAQCRVDRDSQAVIDLVLGAPPALFSLALSWTKPTSARRRTSSSLHAATGLLRVL
jgi:hypothetical protein